MVDVAALTIYYCMASIAESHIGITIFHSYIIVGFFYIFCRKISESDKKKQPTHSMIYVGHEGQKV